MKIVLLHYHLNPGGVTRVIESQLDILNSSREIEQVILLTGGCPDSFKPANTEILIYPELGYLDECNLGDAEMQNLFRYLTDRLLSALSGNCILHAHNLNLGKNPVLTYVVYNLVKNGVRMLNHCHDFAEDRPANWSWMKKIIERGFDRPLHEVLYPENENCHYAVLNSSDRDRMNLFDLLKENIHLLPNPVVISGKDGEISREEARDRISKKLGLIPGKKIITYPVRVIRRKNIGEMILLSSLFPEKAVFLVTLPPKNPLELPEYVQWKNFCSDEGIDIVFEAGEKTGFEEIILGSDSCITTSVREGFGMAFLEPWIFGGVSPALQLFKSSVQGRILRFFRPEPGRSGGYDKDNALGQRDTGKDLQDESLSR
jgi:glycosyltransferase involved in cell wall biosynthesis